LPVDLRWQASQPVTDNYHVFVHLLDGQEQRIAQSDGQPALWTRPTSSWQPGEVIEDRHGLSLPASLPAGDYQLIVGLYLPESGQRLATGDGKSFASLGLVRVTPEDTSPQR
jgi:mannosyltransferase